jgi:hypothetical protein
MRRIRNIVYSWWGIVVMAAIVLFWICLLAVIVFGPRNRMID